MAKSGRDNERLDEYAARYSALVDRRATPRDRRATPRDGREANGGANGFAAAGPRQDRLADADADAPERPGPRSLGEFVSRNIIYLAGVAAVAVVVALGVVFLSRVLAVPVEADAVEEEASYVSPYDWTKLDRGSGRFAYVVDGQVKSRLGIDVSENQHEIDWQAVADDGIEFAMVRLGYRGATEGDLYLDEYYWDNLDGARDAGLDVGVYFFSQATTVEEAVEEADYVLDYLGGTELAYPVAFDAEESVSGVARPRASGVGIDEMTAIAEAFCNRIEQAGYRSIVYGNGIDLSRYRYADMKERAIWWAEYGMPVPTAKIDMAMWQYSNSGEVAGISTAVDMNIDLSAVFD